MLQNFLKITLRNLARNKVYTAISITGLALGISSCLLISLYVSSELSYEDFHEKNERIYRLTSKLFFNGETTAARTSLAAGPTMMEEYPEVENFVRFQGPSSSTDVTVNDRVFSIDNLWTTDSTVFEVFTYELLEGNPQKALTAPRSIVLTQSLREKLFGDQKALGEQIKINNSMMEVTGIMADPPDNTEIKISALLSMSTLSPQTRENFNQDWFRIGFFTFLLFNEPIDAPAFEAKLVEFEKKYVQPWSAENQIEASLEYQIAPLADVHFQRQYDYDLAKGDMSYILVFSLLALFILIIASINYINLSLAQSSKRSKEVGIRKTLGALRQELVTQFLGESMLITLLATVLGLALVELLMGTFNEITGKSLSTTSMLTGPMIMTLLGIILLVGLLAGSYPAAVLSSFRPVRVLKGAIPGKGGIGNLQKGLILLQFIFSLFMITGTVLINDQMRFMQSMNLGFDKENIVTIPLPADTNLAKQVPAWVEELRQDSRIEAASTANMPTGHSGITMVRLEQDGEMVEQSARMLFVDQYFIDVLDLEINSGRNFNKDIATDQREAFVINEQAAEAYGWHDAALGKRVQWGLMANGQAANDGKVVGVVDNFHFLSLHNPMEPLILFFAPDRARVLSLRLQEGDYTSTLASLESRWKEIASNHPFSFTFLDDRLQQNYQQEQAVSSIFDYFAVISILIASLGLFALLSFSIQNRIKEIGIRKVLGASVGQISWILVKDFFYLLIAAFVITTPVCIYLMNRWLEGFAYDVPIHPLSFVLALGMAGLLASVTISFHVFRISKADPVNSLRYE